MKNALSAVMQRSLQAIRDAGGVAHPEQGGWWRGSPDGPRLEIESEDRRGRVTIQTNTIYALFRRGMLEPVEGTGNRTHRAFRLTPSATDCRTMSSMSSSR